MAQRELGLYLDKRQQTSNWARRPLGSEQHLYAADAAEVLVALKMALSAQPDDIRASSGPTRRWPVEVDRLPWEHPTRGRAIGLRQKDVAQSDDCAKITNRATCLARSESPNMPKIVQDAELDEIVKVVGQAPSGILHVAEIQAALGGMTSRRTLQRRVASLVASGRLAQVGRGPAARYHVTGSVVQARGEAHGTSTATARGEAILVPASSAGRELEALVRRPLAHRAPVGYQRAFLDDYVPNVTAYLPSVVREKLHALGRPPTVERAAGTYVRDILGRLLIDLSWASSSLEGNTYTRLDTQNLIEFGLHAQGKDQREAQMILNHKAAIEMLVGDAEGIGFNRYTFQNLHALLSDNLLADEMASGRLRTIPVEITGTVFVPLAIPQQIDELFGTLLAKANTITDPFEQAFFVMVHLPYLQPFEDVNKRVSRLGANIPFIKHNLSPLSFVDVPERAYIEGTLAVYELNRVELLRDVFVWAYERSCLRYVAVRDSLPEPDPLRLRNRAALTEVVGDVVRAGASIDLTDLRQRAAGLVSADDLDQFAAMAFSDLQHLHEGNLARYGLRLSELFRWKGRPPT